MKYRAWLSPNDNPSNITDITDDVAKLYDLVVGSMDWGSGFLDEEDEDTVIKLGVLCGFEVPPCTEHYSASSDIRLAGKCSGYRRHPGLHHAVLRYALVPYQFADTPIEITWSK